VPGPPANPFDPEAYEAWLASFAGAGTALPDLRSPIWRDIYLRESTRIQAAQGAGRSTRQPDPGDERNLALRALVFGQRTALVVQGLVAPGDWLDRRVVDVGAGTGPVAWTAARAGAPRIACLEHGAAERAWLARLLPTLPAEAAQLAGSASPTAFRAARPSDLWVFGASFHELTGGDAARGAALLRPLLARGARALIVEPGTRPVARHLQAVRDRLSTFVRRPCRGAPACPRLQEPDGWCHFTWRRSLGPAATAVLQSAGRHANVVHFAYLELDPAGGSKFGGRLLEVRPRGKRRLDLALCGPQGIERVGVGPRPKGLRKWGEGLEAGSLLELPGHPAPETEPRWLQAPLAIRGGPRST